MPLFEGLSVQLAHILAFYTTKEDFRHRVFAKITSLREQLVGTEGVIGRGTRIVNTKQIIDTRTRENTEICGAELLQNCTIGKNSLIGSGVICRDVITSRGAKNQRGSNRRAVLCRRSQHSGKGLLGTRLPYLFQLRICKRRGGFGLCRTIHGFAPQVHTADSLYHRLLELRQRHQHEQPRLQAWSHSSVGL